MSSDATRPSASLPVGSGARLGASLRVKGEISGNEDLHVDGTVEGLIQLDDRKLTVGMAAKVTADVIAREIVVYGSVKGNLRATRQDRDQEGRLGRGRPDDGAHHDRGRRVLQGCDRNRSPGPGIRRRLFTARVCARGITGRFVGLTAFRTEFHCGPPGCWRAAFALAERAPRKHPGFPQRAQAAPGVPRESFSVLRVDWRLWGSLY